MAVPVILAVGIDPFVMLAPEKIGGSRNVLILEIDWTPDIVTKDVLFIEFEFIELFGKDNKPKKEVVLLIGL